MKAGVLLAAAVIVPAALARLDADRYLVRGARGVWGVSRDPRAAHGALARGTSGVWGVATPPPADRRPLRMVNGFIGIESNQTTR